MARELGWETTSLDVDKKYKPDLLMRIEDFDETQYPKDYFTLVHASTVCTEYSRAHAGPDNSPPRPGGW